jgi:tetratricopeptide (TPR) repeat protein
MMNGKTTCAMAEAGDFVHRYVAETLEQDELERFEIHLLDCLICQEAVRQGVALRAALREPAGGSRRWPVAAWTLPLAAAAALALWFFLPSEGALERLGQVDPMPAFAGLPIRAPADSGAQLSDRGLAAYQAGDYRRAAELLADAFERDTSPAVGFFLGVTQLKTGTPSRALESLAAARQPLGNPYAAEASLYLAKAWLQLGQADSALASLASIPSSAGATFQHARALADSVGQALR